MKTNREIDPADDISGKKRRINAKIEGDKEASRRDWSRYFSDVEKSQCFEVGDYPHIDLTKATGYPMVRRIYDSSHTDEDLEDDMLLYLSKLAMCFYNIREETDFQHVKLVMATRSGIKNENHYITFQAFSSTRTRKRVAVTFQTHIVVDFVSPFPKFEIMFVRIKPSESHQNNSINSQQAQPQAQPQPSEFDHDKPQIYQNRLSQVIQDSGLDSQYTLPLYLSQYALLKHNLSKLSLNVAKHDIESLKVIKLMKPAAPVPTYHITFEAPLRAKTKIRNVHTFKIVICMPSLYPTTIVELRKSRKLK